MKLSLNIRVIAISAILFAACGDDITKQINANVGAVETSKDLPECTKDIAGQTAFITETHEFLGCDGSEWQSLSAGTVSVGDNVCTSKSLTDDSGFEIFCNGESIGTVKNGEKGDKGDKGDSGSGCEITESTGITATIACGSETFTMDLAGYVEQPAECDADLYEDCTGSLDSVKFSGVSQKGPFVTGTDITAYELENGRSLKQTGKTFGGKIEREDGTFDIKTVKLKSTFAYLVADGFYRNEVTGENSTSTIKLRALTNLQGRTAANINLVTHLEYDRVQRLVTKQDSSVLKAKKATEKEIFAAFGIDNKDFKGFAEDFNILEKGDGNAALLAISVLLQGDRNESELTSLLAALSVDLGDNGKWDNEKLRAQVADWAMKKDIDGGLATIRKNIKAWKLRDSEPPAFEGYVTNFWMQELGVGECTKKNAGTLFATKNKKSAYYAAKDSIYTEGDSSLVRLICDASGESPAWRFASNIEKDTLAFAAASVGAVKRGSVDTMNVYVKEGEWRYGTELDMTLDFSCIADSVGKIDTMVVDGEIKWFICDEKIVLINGELVSSAWRAATTAEADTAGFGIPSEDDTLARIGNVNKSNYYVFDDVDEDGEGEWRHGTELDYVLGPCTKANLDTVKNTITTGGDTLWFKCASDRIVIVNGKQLPHAWRESSAYEKDMPYWESKKDTTPGTLLKGAYSQKTMVWDDSTLREASKHEIWLNRGCVTEMYWTKETLDNSLTYTCDDSGWSKTGTFYDSRDKRTYQAVQIDKQVWMAEHLNYKVDSSFCYNGEESNCAKYGRLYKWAAAVGKSESVCGSSILCSLPSENIQGVCPTGWHLPSKAEWETLFETIGGVSTAAVKLKSSSGWNTYNDGADVYGFSARPAGERGATYKYDNEGESAYFWSSTEKSTNTIYYVALFRANIAAIVNLSSKNFAYSVRCVKD